MSGLYLKVFKRYFSSTKSIPKVCIVGGGPAGFYAAQHLVKNVSGIQVDIVERLPVPFGLVRFGVAPDHPEVKNVINTFTKTAQNPNVNFIGNVNLGVDVTLQQLKEAYNAVLLTYGADKDRLLNIPGEDLTNVISARNIVGWYNGVPWNKDLKIDLSGPTAVIIGQGNVAIDVARILLTSIDILKSTDITQHALEMLMTSNIKKVYLVGRRGPLQAAFTIKELREMLKLPNCQCKWCPEDFTDVEDAIPKLSRPKKRITELMLKSMKEDPKPNAEKQLIMKYFRSPLEFVGEDKVSRIKLGVNELVGDDLLNKRAVLTRDMEILDCDLAVRSIGYKSIKADSNIPFDDNQGVVLNKHGKVDNTLYAAGWLGTGPTGVILSTMSNSFQTADAICNEFKNPDTNIEPKPGYERLKQILEKSNTRIVTWQGWEKIDKHEQEMGKKVGKPREKILCIDEMLKIGAS